MDNFDFDVAAGADLARGLPGADSPIGDCGPIRIWLIDNDVQIRELFAESLQSQPGLHCDRQFSAIRPALDALSHQPAPDVILLDLNLDRECGLDAIRPVKALAPSTQVLMLTTFNDADSAAEAFQAGASGFLLKTYTIDRIVMLVRAVRHNPRSPGLFPDFNFIRSARAPKPAVSSSTEVAGRTSRRKSQGILRALLAVFTM